MTNTEIDDLLRQLESAVKGENEKLAIEISLKLLGIFFKAVNRIAERY